jgi:putative tricarboxylic transport membrane protein
LAKEITLFVGMSLRIPTLWARATLHMKRSHLLPLIFWIGLGLFVLVHSYSLGLKGITGPGPGLMPFLVSFLLLLVSSYLLITSLLKKRDGDDVREEGQSTVNLRKVSLVVASLIAYAVFMEGLGFLITTTLLLITLLKGMGSKKWSSVVMVSVLTSLITYFAFTYLRLRLPMGILRF